MSGGDSTQIMGDANQISLKYRVQQELEDAIEQHKTLQSQLKKKMGKNKKDEKKQKKYENQMDRLTRTKVNLDLLMEAFEEQNQSIKPNDIENDEHLMFKKRSGKKTDDLQSQNNKLSTPIKEPEDDEQPLTAQEEALLAKFEENDKEIDEMLEGVIDQVDRLKLQA